MWRKLLLCLMGLAVVGTACSGADDHAALDDSQEPVEDAAPDAAIDDQPTELTSGTVAVIEQDVDWRTCFGNAECANILVPLDYDDVDGDTVELAVTRWVASDTSNRIGPLFVNPGGPGFGAEFMVSSLVSFAPFELSERFDIIGIDPRGTGGSYPIDCNSNWEEDINTPVTVDDGLADDVEMALDDFEALAAECLDEYGEAYLASITTENVARDHEAVRILLGGEPMNFMGASYGTTLGSVYATMFPDNLRSLVLDGAVLPDAGLLSPDEWPDLQLQLERLEASCDAWEECPLTEGWIAATEDLETRLVKGPIGPLTLGEFYNAVGLPFAAPSFMPDVAFGIAEALNNEGAELSSLSNSLLTPLVETGNPAEYAGGLQAIHCADGIEWSQVDSTDVLAVAEETATAEPDLGPFFGIPCDLWPVQGDGLDPIDYRGDAPVLVIGNTGDAITALRYAADMAEAFGEPARLLTWDATGHVAFSYGSECIDDFTVTYLIELTLPPADTVCPLTGFIGIELDWDLEILRVSPGTAAELAGLARRDIIVSIDGVTLASLDDFSPFLPGQSVSIVVDRGGNLVEVDVTADYPVWELWRLAE